jgi:hypothetical protein
MRATRAHLLRSIAGAFAGFNLGFLIERCLQQPGVVEWPWRGPIIGSTFGALFAVILGKRKLKGKIKHTVVGGLVGASSGYMWGSQFTLKSWPINHNRWAKGICGVMKPTEY